METIESLQAQVAVLKTQLIDYYNANYALGYRNSQLEQVGLTAVVVAEVIITAVR